jgi:tetratricopeptide (TPR) repeat protein
LEHKDRENYADAQDAMRRYWRAVGERPKTEELHPPVAAEVLLTVGILTGWIGSKNQTKTAQETAKDLISESITYFDSVRDFQKVAAARVELAFCYYREGELNEARDMIREALEKLTPGGNTRARALLKLSALECSAARFHEAHRILNDDAPYFRHSGITRLRAAITKKWRSSCETSPSLKRETITLRKPSVNSRRPITNSNLLVILSIVRT